MEPGGNAPPPEPAQPEPRRPVNVRCLTPAVLEASGRFCARALPAVGFSFLGSPSFSPSPSRNMATQLISTATAKEKASKEKLPPTGTLTVDVSRTCVSQRSVRSLGA